ncbi:MAG: hypothetical protein LBN95_06225 [Prevotellaceae bacterium]|jgi:hypothetical protein|nr:hypothetical protein [Prevotellaceae bacterium]
MKKIILIGIFGIAAITATAQPRSIGVRLGINQELSFQQYVRNEDNIIQFDAGAFAAQGAQVSLTFNWITPAKNSNFASYGGFGVGGGYSAKDNFWYYKYKDGATLPSYVFFGITGMIGLEYTFDNIPLAIALDYRPLIGIDVGKKSYNKITSTDTGINLHTAGFLQLGLSVKYLF